MAGYSRIRRGNRSAVRESIILNLELRIANRESEETEQNLELQASPLAKNVNRESLSFLQIRNSQFEIHNSRLPLQQCSHNCLTK